MKLEKISVMFSSSKVSLALFIVTLSEAALSPGYLADVNSRYESKPIINHTFKEAHAQPHWGFALLFFVLAIVGPAFAFITVLKKSGSRIVITDNAIDRAFVGVIFSSLILLGMFFYALNLVQTTLLAMLILALGFVTFPIETSL